MKSLIFLVLSLLSAPAFAQMEVQEVYTSNKLTVLGRPFNFSFFNLASIETDKFNDDGGRLSTYSYLTASTRFGDDFRFAVRLPFTYSSAGTDRFDGDKVNSADTELQDIIVGVQNPNFVMLPLDLDLYWELRSYLPTSKASSQQGLITRLRNEFIFTKILSRRFEVGYDQKFSYYFQSRSTYQNTFRDELDFERTVSSSTKRSELDHWVDAWFKFTPQIGIGWMLGEEDTTWYSSAPDVENKNKPAQHMIKTGPQFRFPIGDHANFILAYEDLVDRDHNRAEFGKFQAQNTQFTLLSFIGF